jgi:hypothetical protein
MKIYKVYHNSACLDHLSFHWGDKVMPQTDKLDLVATVNAESLEDVFRCTNHIDWEWWENPNVLSFLKSRSTSCGDVIEEMDTGKRYVVAAVGFKEMI